MTIAHDFPNWDPVQYASQGNAILGIRDSGKTVTAEGRAEKLMDAGIPITVIDPIGRWRFLRVPGTGAGYPIVVAGGMEGDLPLTPANAEALIRAAMKNRVSIVFDLYAMDISKADWRRICEAVIRTMLYENKQYGLRHIFIEEAAEFAPQRVQPGQGQVYAEVEKLARMGGNALLGYTLINQRAEEVNKAVLELCDTLILHRQKGRNSLTALEKWLKVAGTKVEAKKIVDTMPMLRQGEAWAWISSSDKPLRIQFPLKRSFVPDRRSMVGASLAAEAVSPDVETFIKAMKDALAAGDLVDEIKRDKAAPKVLPAPQPIDVEAIRNEAHTEGYHQGYAAAAMQAQDGISRLRQSLTDANEAGRVQIEQLLALFAPSTGLHPRQQANGNADHIGAARGLIKRDDVARAQITSVMSDTRRGAGGAELRILRVLAARSPARFTKAQWATLAGMKRTGGTWQTYVSRLRQAGYIEERDGLFGLTGAGAKAAGHVSRPSAGTVIEDWKIALGSGPSKMIDQLVAAHPHGMDRANLADRVGMTAGGGTFQTYLSRLKSNGLIDVDKRRIKATETLFIDGRRQ